MKRPHVTIIDYGVGNLASVANMINRAGGKADISGDVGRIRTSDRLLLPGVGAFDTCRSALAGREGLEDTIMELVSAGVPLLGICVGMQLLANASDEGVLPGLGIIAGNVRKFDFAGQPEHAHLRVPHMGWSIVTPQGRSRLLSAFEGEPARFYFVHSYHFVCDVPADIAGHAFYGLPFTAAIERDSVFGVQFHPEKSHSFGQKLLNKFLTL